MLSRRRFVQASSIALTGTACGVASEGSAAESGAGDLPAPIAALKSMKDQATAISVDERRARIEKAKRLMAEHHVDALMLMGGTSMVYFTGMQWGLSERMTAVIIPAKGNAFIVTPKFEEERTLEQARTGPLGADTRVMTWEEDESPSDRVAQGLRTAGIASGTLGVEETVRFTFANAVGTAAPAIRLANGTSVTAGCRMVKDQHELALMRLASQVTHRAYEAAWKCLKEGMTQNDFADLVSKAHTQLGFEGGAGVQVGEYSALPHGSVQPQTVREGTILLIDGGCKVEGYSSDLSRTFVLGKPTDRMRQVFEIEHQAQTTAVRTARPGLECQAVDAAARKVIEDAGFGPGYKFFTHRVGHGMGMDGHEWPYLVKGNTLKLQPGMVFSDEPGIYIPGEFGCRLEDDMVITESGAELFTPQSESLEKPF